MSKRRLGSSSVLEIPSPSSVPRRTRTLLGGRYELDEDDQHLGQGAQSIVQLAVDVKTGERVAVKRLKNHREVEFPIADYFREVCILKELPKHECIVELLDVISTREELSLVFEACECDLRQFLKSQGPLAQAEYRLATLHLWAGLDQLHSLGIAHRDIKTCNVLLKNGYCKLGDVGLGKHIFDKSVLGGALPMTREVSSLWYRAPEIVLGVFGGNCLAGSLWTEGRHSGGLEEIRVKGTEMDVWSLGCVLYEMATGKALLAVESETNLLMRIFSTFGTANYGKMPKYTEKWPRYTADSGENRKLSTELRTLPIDGAIVDLIFKCLKVDPRLRITVKEALANEIYNF
jgi:serine/threonine protein kinase